MHERKYNPDNISDFKSPISLEVMTDPVTCFPGQSFDRKDIENWLKISNKHPFGGHLCTADQLIPNKALRLAIKDYQFMQITDLQKVYHQRGIVNINALKAALSDLQKAARTRDMHFKINSAATDWPFALICPRSQTVITDPVITSSGATYQRTATKYLNEEKIPNINLKNVLSHFKLEIDETLRSQIKTINQLKQEILKAETSLNAAIKSVRRKKMIIGGTLAVTAISYTVSTVIDLINEDPNNNQKEISSNLFKSLLRPVVSSFSVGASVLYSTFNSIFDDDNTALVKKGKASCLAGMDKEDLPTSFCRHAIVFALTTNNIETLKEFHKTIALKFFKDAMMDIISLRDLKYVKMLVELDKNIISNNPYLLPHIASLQFTDNAQDKMLGIINYLLDQGCMLDNGYSPLLMAIRAQNTEIAKLLIHRGASLKSTDGRNLPLTMAIDMRNLRITKIIVARDAELAKEILSTRPHIIEKLKNEGDFEMLKVLGYGIHKLDQNELLKTAIDKLNLDEIESLIQKGAKFPKLNEKQANELHLIFCTQAARGNMLAVKEILKNNTINQATLSHAIANFKKSKQLTKEQRSTYLFLRNLQLTQTYQLTHKQFRFYQPRANQIISKHSARQMRHGR